MTNRRFKPLSIDSSSCDEVLRLARATQWPGWKDNNSDVANALDWLVNQWLAYFGIKGCRIIASWGPQLVE
jgi:hypothetical protein